MKIHSLKIENKRTLNFLPIIRNIYFEIRPGLYFRDYKFDFANNFRRWPFFTAFS